MKKAEIIKAVAESTGEDKKIVADICNAFLYEIKEMLISGGSVEIAGFGKFTIVEYKERPGRNPRTGEEIMLPAYNVVKFTSAKNLKDGVNGR